MLENRAPEWQDGKTGHVLDATDLASVEVGAAGMRAWTADEARLVEASRRVEEQRKAQELGRKRLIRNFVYALAGAFVSLAVATSIFAWVERGEADGNQRQGTPSSADRRGLDHGRSDRPGARSILSCHASVRRGNQGR